MYTDAAINTAFIFGDWTKYSPVEKKWGKMVKRTLSVAVVQPLHNKRCEEKNLSGLGGQERPNLHLIMLVTWEEKVSWLTRTSYILWWSDLESLVVFFFPGLVWLDELDVVLRALIAPPKPSYYVTSTWTVLQKPNAINLNVFVRLMFINNKEINHSNSWVKAKAIMW